MTTKRILTLASATMLASATLMAQSQKGGQKADNAPVPKPAPVSITKINGKIDFDGRPDEAVWATLPEFKLTQAMPQYNQAPSEESDVRIGYDDTYIWIGAKLYTSDPSKIRATTKKRDDLPENTDAFGVLLDTFKDNENGFAFYTTPNGTRMDEGISGDASTGGGRVGGVWKNNWENTAWNSFWDVKTSTDKQGWYVEMRIPFSTIKFKPGPDGVTNMGLIINRVIASNNEKATWPVINGPKYNKAAAYKASLAGEINFADAKSRNPLYFTPYVSLGNTSRKYLNPARNGYDTKQDFQWNIGFDTRYALGSNLTLDITVNPDFGNAEADDQEVNLTQYSINLAEKRSFFQERSSLFDFTLDASTSSNLFYSRNIGINSDAGEQVRIWGGARLTGRIGKWDFGVLDMQTEDSQFKNYKTAENFSVIRGRRNVINDKSFFGGIITSRLGFNGNADLGYGLEGTFNIYKDHYLTLKGAGNYNNYNWGQANNTRYGDYKFNKSLFGLFLAERRSETGFAYLVRWYYSGAQFLPQMSYIQKKQMDSKQAVLKYGYAPGRDSKWFLLSAKFDFQNNQRVMDHGLDQQKWNLELTANSKSGYQYSLTGTYERDGLLNHLNIAAYDYQYDLQAKKFQTVGVNTGFYQFWYVGGSFSTPKARPFKWETIVRLGQYYDGNLYKAQLAPVWAVNKSLQMQLTYEFDHIRFTSRGQHYNLHSLAYKLNYMYNTKLSAQLYTQYTGTADELNSQLRFRYNPSEGHDLYIVLSDDRYFGNYDANLYNMYKHGSYNDGVSWTATPGFNYFTIMAKYQYTFTFAGKKRH